MKHSSRKLALEQLDKKLQQFRPMQSISVPDRGWIHAIRVSLNMPLRQFAKRMGITPQSVNEIEEREATGVITMNSLRTAAEALEMKLVYVLLPKDASLEEMIERRARVVARSIVQRTATSMALEDQGVSKERLEAAITAKTADILQALPRTLWD